MAVSTIPKRAKIGSTVINIGGIEITNQDGSWYYVENISVDMPQNAQIVGVSYGNFSAGVFALPRPNGTISLVAYKSMTVPQNRNVKVFYAY